METRTETVVDCSVGTRARRANGQPAELGKSSTRAFGWLYLDQGIDFVPAILAWATSRCVVS